MRSETISKSIDLPPCTAGSVEAFPALLAATVVSTSIAAQVLETKEISSAPLLGKSIEPLEPYKEFGGKAMKGGSSSEVHGFVKGASSSVVSNAATIPIDTIQQRKMTGSAGSIQEEVRHIRRTYFKQFAALVPARIATGGLFLVTLNKVSGEVTERTNPMFGLVCGSAAASVAEQGFSLPLGAVTHQIRKGSVSHIKEAVSLISAKSGVSGFYKGFTLSAVSSAWFNMLLFPTVKFVREKVDQISPSFSQSGLQTFLLGGAISTAIMPLTYPLYRAVVAQREGVEGNVGQVFKQIVKNQGVSGLYKGVLWSVPRNFVATGALFGTGALVDRVMVF